MKKFQLFLLTITITGLNFFGSNLQAQSANISPNTIHSSINIPKPEVLSNPSKGIVLIKNTQKESDILQIIATGKLVGKGSSINVIQLPKIRLSAYFFKLLNSFGNWTIPITLDN